MPIKRIAVVPGDGIGKEVIPATIKVVQATGAAVDFANFDWSADRYLKDGVTIPADGFAMLARDFDAIFVGALGDPRVPSNIHAKEILLGMRFKMDLYANVRPVKLLYESLCPLENVKSEEIVTNNMFGAIITDLAAALQGGLGMAASGNIHPGKTSMFEPVHGSAPPFAGKNIANPIGAISTAAMMLEHLGFSKEAERINHAVLDAVQQNKTTSDIGGSLGPQQSAA